MIATFLSTVNSLRKVSHLMLTRGATARFGNEIWDRFEGLNHSKEPDTMTKKIAILSPIRPHIQHRLDTIVSEQALQMTFQWKFRQLPLRH